jgi:LacI family transcriptional regulator
MPNAPLAADNPKYLVIADHLRREIESGVLAPGDRLPTFVELRERFGTTPSTVDRAHAVLEREGLIIRGQGRRGTQVVGRQVAAKRHIIGCLGFEFRLVRNYPYWMHLLAGMQRAADESGFELLMLGQARNIGWERMDGLILHREYSKEFVDSLPRGLPMVSVIVPLEGVSSVVADDFEGARRATQYLLDLGHKRIGALMISESPLPRLRLAGYREALRGAGITPNDQWVCQFNPGGELGSLRACAKLDMAKWLTGSWRDSGLTAVLAQNDEVAIGIMDAITEAGLRVPEDISVVGFDGTEEGERCTPQLTTIAVPLEQIGATAMELLLRQVGTARDGAGIITLPAQLVMRGSVAKPRLATGVTVSA